MLTASFVVVAVRIALAIVFDTAALVIWDIGTRSPVRLVSDMRAALQRKSAVVRGIVRFAAGTVALIVAAMICAPVATGSVDFTLVEGWALVTALVLEGLIGPDLRAHLR